MTVYVVAQLKMKDEAAYNRYLGRFFAVFRNFNGTLLSADDNPAVVEGEWDRDRVVMMSFPDEPSFRAWAESPGYVKISRDRKAGADCLVLLVKGYEPAA